MAEPVTPPASGGILALPSRIAALPAAARERAERIYDVRLVQPHTDPPPALETWLTERFGSADAVRVQTVLKVTNRVTLEATLFAPLRAKRPIDGRGDGDDRDARLAGDIAATMGDPFCAPETGTPANTFGRVRGARTITGANAAAIDGHHGVIVFDAHDPLTFDEPLVGDLFRTARAWADRARRDDPDAANYLLIWNCLWRAGGSIVHGHAQVLVGSGAHYARLERWRRDAATHFQATGERLVDEMLAIHRDLGLAHRHSGGAWTVAHLTPVKEREVLIVGAFGSDERDPGFVSAAASALTVLRDAVGMRSFNLAVWRPPLTSDGRVPAGWEGMPPIARIVDRGDPFERPSDIGGMELYGTPVVSADPYRLIGQLAEGTRTRG
jgi:hypothetical protein